MRAVKSLAYCVAVLLLAAMGWFARGMMPAKAAGGAPKGPAMMGGMGGPPEVMAAPVQEVSLRPPAEYVGRVEAIQDAEIYAQISGTIQKVNFEEGRLVKKGDLLFTIDPERYGAQVQVAEAALEQAKASLGGAKADLEAAEANLKAAQANRDYADRYQKRVANADARGVAQTDKDKAESDALRAGAQERQASAQIGQKKAQIQQFEAQIHQAEADLKLARINLGYTEVRSPIDGRIGRAEATCGDYVSPGNGLLARIAQVDPVRVRFSISDREYLDLLKDGGNEGLQNLKTTLRLPNGESFAGGGKLDFVDNQMNPGAGAIAIFARFENPKGLLVANSFVTVLMERENGPRAIAIPQEAVMTNQNGEYVYVVASGGAAELRSVKLGDQAGVNRIVVSGLKPGENVIVSGLQKVIPGQPVKVIQAGGAARPEGA